MICILLMINAINYALIKYQYITSMIHVLYQLSDSLYLLSSEKSSANSINRLLPSKLSFE